MDIKKFVLAVLAYFVITMAWAYPWHVIWFHDLYVELGAFTREAPIMPLGMAAVIIQGVVMAYFYPLYYRGGHPVAQGIKFSLIIGLMVYTVMGFATAAKIRIEPVSTYLLYHTIFQFIQFTVAGAVIGLIFGTQVKSTE